MERHKNIPKMRFPEFNGEWKIESTGNYIDLISGYAFKGDEISEDSDGIPILRGINITEGVIRHSDDIDRYFSGDISQLKKYLLRKGDIVLGMDGSKVGKNVAIISDKDENSLLIQRVAKINSNPKSDYRFIFQRIFSPVFHQYVDVVNTSSGIPHISLQQIRDFKVGYPSLPEQQKIASFFTTIDQKISQLKRKKTLLEHYKKGVMQKIFSQEIRFRDDNGQEFPKREKKKLGELTYKTGKKNKDSIPYPIFSINNREGFLPQGDQFEGVDSNSRGYDISLYKIIEEKTFAYNPARINVGSIGFSGDLKNIIISSLYVCFKTKQGLEDAYLLHYLKTFQFNKSVLQNVEGGVRDYLFYENFSNIKINLPTNKEQLKIATFLSAIDDKINHTLKQIEKAEGWKKGLMQQMFC